MNITKQLNSQGGGRSSSFELIRIFSMVLIVTHHLCVHGIQQCLWPNLSTYGYWGNATFINTAFIFLFKPAGPIGVGLFFMISGYFSVNSKFKPSRLIKLVSQILFYSFFCIVSYLIIYRCGFYDFPEFQHSSSFLIEILKKFIQAIIPISYSLWWFPSAYVFLFLISPALNQIFTKLNLYGWIIVLVLLYLLWYVPSSAFNLPYLNIQKAIFFYALGAFFSCNKDFKISRFTSLVFAIGLWFCCAYLPSFAKVFNNSGFLNMVLNFGFRGISTLLYPFSAFFLFAFFANFDFQSKVVNLISSTTFGIYLFHDSYVFRAFLFNCIFKPLRFIKSSYFILYAVFVVVIIFALGFFIDLCRIRFLEKPFMKKTKVWLLEFKTRFFK